MEQQQPQPIVLLLRLEPEGFDVVKNLLNKVHGLNAYEAQDLINVQNTLKTGLILEDRFKQAIIQEFLQNQQRSQSQQTDNTKLPAEEPAAENVTELKG